MPTPAQLIQAALDQLEQQPDIPAYLAAHGHHGYVGSCSACPVADYLETSTELRVDVHLDEWEYDHPDDAARGPLPPRVQRSVERFDMGELIDLIAPPRGMRRVQHCTCAAWDHLHELGCGWEPVDEPAVGECVIVHRPGCEHDCGCQPTQVAARRPVAAGPVSAMPYAAVPR